MFPFYRREAPRMMMEDDEDENAGVRFNVDTKFKHIFRELCMYAQRNYRDLAFKKDYESIKSVIEDLMSEKYERSKVVEWYTNYFNNPVAVVKKRSRQSNRDFEFDGETSTEGFIEYVINELKQDNKTEE